MILSGLKTLLETGELLTTPRLADVRGGLREPRAGRVAAQLGLAAMAQIVTR